MKNLLFLLMAILCPVFMFGQTDDVPDVMYETVLITPENDDPLAFSEALKKHNRTYHKDGAHAAHVYSINTGPNTGKLLWMMGPCTFADLDTRPDCNKDWQTNVAPHIELMEAGEYWELDADLSKLPQYNPNVSPMPIVRVRYHEFERGVGNFRVEHHLKQISETIKSMEGELWWGVFDNLFRQGYAAGARPHLATISLHKNWAGLDQGWKFKKHFVAKYGEQAWQPFLDEGSAIHTNTWDEIWQLVPDMSGPEYSTSGEN
jgi:hypothetical protein